MFLMILTSIFHERIFWVIIFGVIIFKKPKVIKKLVTNITKVRKHFLNSPRAPYNFRFNNNEKSEKKQTNCLQSDVARSTKRELIKEFRIYFISFSTFSTFSTFQLRPEYDVTSLRSLF